MRESNFAFPAQNRASVCITSQLYDRRALDTNSPLPLFNSLTHLTYLTSTSPRIREIMTMDGGLERLVRILLDFCMCPPPPDNPAILYGLTPPNSAPAKLEPTLVPKQFDKGAAYRFSLAFQSVVNIGVRGSEFIRGRVVQAGTLEVVGCILEAWLASKGFAVGPSVTPTGVLRETREQRIARRQAQYEARQREQAIQLARALRQQISTARPERPIAPLEGPSQESESMDVDTSSSTPSRDTDTSGEPSSNTTPLGSSTPTGAVLVPGRDRSGTIIARPVWDNNAAVETAGPSGTRRGHRAASRQPDASNSDGASPSRSTDNSRPETETEDDMEMDQDSMRESDAPVSGASTPDRRPGASDTGTIRGTGAHPRRAVGIVSDVAPATASMDSDAHIIINGQAGAVDGVGVEDGIVSLETNDDFAMGAPPGAPGAINGPPRTLGDGLPTGERTPRAGPTTLPGVVPPVPTPGTATATIRMRTLAPEGGNTADPLQRTRLQALGAGAAAAATGRTGNHHTGHHHRSEESGPYRDEDVLLSLQLLAYLSKYPHVRQAFYKPRPSFHPATLKHEPPESAMWRQPSSSSSKQPTVPAVETTPQPPVKETNSFLKTFASVTGRGKEKEKVNASTTVTPTASTATAQSQRMTNVFSLVERFTYRPSSAELESPNPPPTLPTEIQYWAGVIMRNACRKDESRGGIRQCANMMCGKWEQFPREFAKCRRCRKAKYCGKECQSIAWNEGHRFWCSAKDPEEDGDHHHHGENAQQGDANGNGDASASAGTATTARSERRAERRAEREREIQALRTLEAGVQAQVRQQLMENGVQAESPGVIAPPTTRVTEANRQLVEIRQVQPIVPSMVDAATNATDTPQNLRLVQRRARDGIAAAGEGAESELSTDVRRQLAHIHMLQRRTQGTGPGVIARPVAGGASPSTSPVSVQAGEGEDDVMITG